LKLFIIHCFKKYIKPKWNKRGKRFVRKTIYKVLGGLFDWCSILHSGNITIDFIIKNTGLIKNNINYAILNTNLSLEDFEKTYHLNWDYDYVSRRTDLTIDFIRRNIDKNWNWTGLSYNKAISLDIIKNNPDLPWDKYFICKNPTATYKDIIALYQEDPYYSCRIIYNDFKYYNSIITIQRAWRRYIKRKHNSIYKYVMNELTMNPHLNPAGFRGHGYHKWCKKMKKLMSSNK
jgi:hypothetical protein